MTVSAATARSGTDPGLEYLAGLEASFREAAAAAGALEDELEIAGIRLRLRFAGPRMRDLLLPPLAHLAAGPGGDPELTISVFDTASTGIEPPALPWRPAPGRPGTNPIARFESERSCVLAPAEGGGLTACDLAAGEAFFHLPSAAAVPVNERAAQLREALHLLMATRCRWMTHAGAVGRGGRGVLLAGPSGSGKSTLALSCALNGLDLVADDHVILEPGPPALAHAVQSTVKLTAASAELLGIEAGSLPGPGFGETIEGPPKAEVDLEALAPGALRGRLEIGAVLAPSIGGSDPPRLEPISPGAGLRALAPSTLIQLRSRNATALPALAALVRSVPSHALELSADPSANAALVAEVVDGLG